MKENRIKTSAVLENQLPSFVLEEYPLFAEFLKKYYDSLEYQGAIKDILENIDQYVKIDKITNLVEGTTLSEDIDTYNSEIFVESTQGFPLKSGLIQINDEIIFYTNRDIENNKFVGCFRGFSGRTTETNAKQDQLVFRDTDAVSHKSGSTVKNLSILFLKIFLEKSKKQFTPGFENREFYPGLNERNFIKQAKNFYETKGTDSSFKILFKALYGSNVDVIRPADFLFEPSNASFKSGKIITVEKIQGNPEKLLNKTLYQDQYGSILTKAFASINNIVKIFENDREYYIFGLDESYDEGQFSVSGEFSIHPCTYIISDVSSGTLDSNNVLQYQDFLDVDSTIGFPDSGTLYIDFKDGQDLEINYTSKTINQFLGCTGLTRGIERGQKVRLYSSAYGYGDSVEDIIEVRVTGILSEITFPKEAYYTSKNDTIEISSIGYVEEDDFRSNNWITNVSTRHEVKELRDNKNFNYEIVTYDPINILPGDQVILNGIIRTQTGNVENVTRTFDATPGADPFRSFKITNDTDLIYVYYVERKLRKVPGTNLTSDVQNVYVDNDRSTYIACPSLPYYYNQNADAKNRVIYFDANLQNDSIIPAFNHGFLTGEAVAYIPVSSTNKLNIDKGIYFVKKVDNDRLRLARSRADITSENYLNLTGQVSRNILSPLSYVKIDPDPEKNLAIQSVTGQKLVRKIQNAENDEKIYTTVPGKTGIFLNGVEIINYKTGDVIKYGPLTDIFVAASGKGYDIINPPVIDIKDDVGVGGSAFCKLTGSLERVDIVDPGFDYITEPIISFKGGNGKNAKAKVNLISFTHSIIFNAIEQANVVNLENYTFNFQTYHRFRSGEKVVYKTQNETAIGGLINNSIYYVGVLGSKKITLHNTYENALGLTSPIVLTSYGTGNHIFESYNKKKRIGSIRVLDAGSGFSNKKNLLVESNVNVYTNTITIINHGYNTGEEVVYTSNSPVGGLISGNSYYILKINNNSFRLTEKDSSTPIKFTSTGDGEFNYPEIVYNLSGNIGISSYYSTGFSGIATFNSNSPNFVGISTFNIKIGEILTPVAGFIATDTKVTSIGIGSIGISTSHLYSSVGVATTSVAFNEYVDFNAKLIPVFRGEIDGVFLKSGGVGYGSSDCINHEKLPQITLVNGRDARAIPIVNDGTIKQVLVQIKGKDYNSQPNIEVVGDGVGAQLTPIIQNGEIIRIEVITGGKGYNPNNTSIRISSPGSEGRLLAKITNWNVNRFARLNLNDQISEDGGVIVPGRDGLQCTHLYPPTLLRESIYSFKDDGETIFYQSDLQNDRSTVPFHSPIIGWAYDGNPIYGPYGYENPAVPGNVSQMKSGYVSTRKPNRPSLFPSGFFIEDFEFRNEGTLDEFNGRYCRTPEYPNGVYAYFTTFTENIVDAGNFSGQKLPVFPYVIGDSFRSSPIKFNYDALSNQDDFNFVSNNLIRNTIDYNVSSKNSEYPYFVNSTKIRKQTADVKASSTGYVDNVQIISGGEGYKIGDQIIFDNKNTGGFGAAAVVSEIVGKKIGKIQTESTVIENVEVIPSKDVSNEYIFICKDPHSLNDNEIIDITGINTNGITLQKSYKISTISNTLQLRSGIGTVFATGITTVFEVSGNFREPFIYENDYYQVGNELIKVLKVDPDGPKITVLRNLNGEASTHNAGTFLIEKSRKFKIKENVQNYNYSLTREYYFDPNKSVGLGTTNGVGITSTLFLDKITYGGVVNIGTGSSTILYFQNVDDILNFSGGYVDLRNSTDSSFDISKKKIISVGTTSITIDFDTTALSGSGVTSYLDKWNTVDIPIQSLYLPNHQFYTGQKVLYYSNVGTGITVSIASSIQILKDGQELYVARISDNLIGISTVKVGVGTTGNFVGIETSTNLLEFVGFGTGLCHSFKTTNIPLLSSIQQHLVSVYTETDPIVKIGDTIKIKSLPSSKQYVSLVYDEETRRVLSDRKTFSSARVNIEENTITIPSHGYNNGDKIIYKSTIPVGGLQNNQFYYAIVVDVDRIKLSKFSTNLENNIVDLTSESSGIFYKVNPKIITTQGRTLVFDLSDSSLSYIRGAIKESAFTLNFYTDIGFTQKFISSKNSGNFEISSYGQIGISTNARVELKITEELPNPLFYKLTPILNPLLPTSKKECIVDDIDFKDHSRLVKQLSIYNGEHLVVGVSTTSFAFTLDRFPENNVYNNTIDGTFDYVTTSPLALGAINSIKMISGGRNYKRLPFISGVKSINGKNALIYPITNTIGKVQKITINDSGYDYPSDLTLKPQARLPQIVKINPLASFESIFVFDEGKNYSTAPGLIVKDGYTNKVINDVLLRYRKGDTYVSIIRNTKSMYGVTPTLIPINNSNGIPVKNATYNRLTKEVTLTLTNSYSSIEDFPLLVGDEILVENIASTEDPGFRTRGYNSEGYGYHLFTITSIDPNIGGSNATIVYSLSGQIRDTQSPGLYDETNSLGKIIPKRYFPTFNIKLAKNDFYQDESVETENASGIIEYWDKENQLLKISTGSKLSSGDILYGKSSYTKAVIKEVTTFTGFYEIKPTSRKSFGWDKTTGFLNDALQRLHDNDYYQNLSYSLKSDIPLDQWDEAVTALNHTAGFKKFSDLMVESRDKENTGIKTEQFGSFSALRDLTTVIDLNCINDFDIATEQSVSILGRNVSEQIALNGAVIQDYAKSIGNKVLLIDDISPQFNSEPRLARFSMVDKFRLTEIRARKYIVNITDKRFTGEKEILLITLLHNGREGYLNQYGRVETVDDLGYFDFEISGEEGSLLFYPQKYEFNDYNTSYIAFDLTDTNVVGIVTLGSSTRIRTTNQTITSGIGSTTVFSMPATQQSAKIILQYRRSDGAYEFDELSVTHDGTNVEVLEYGQLTDIPSGSPYSGPGFGTYVPYIDNGEVKLDLVLSGISTLTANSFIIDFSDSLTGIASTSVNTGEVRSNYTSIASTTTPTENIVAQFSNIFGGAYFFASIKDLTNNKMQVCEIIVSSESTNASISEFAILTTGEGTLGTFNAESNGTNTYLKFTPLENIDVDLRIFQTSVKIPTTYYDITSIDIK